MCGHPIQHPKATGSQSFWELFEAGGRFHDEAGSKKIMQMLGNMVYVCRVEMAKEIMHECF